MKTSFLRKISFVFGLAAFTANSVSASSVDEEGVKVNHNTVKVLIVALPDNVGSNYFPNSMIAEETGIPTDSIDYTYNQVMVRNIIAGNKDKKYQFVTPQKAALISKLLEEVKLQGEEERK